MLDRRRRRAMLSAAARAVTARGMVIAEFPNLLGQLARPLLVFEGLGSLPVATRGGTTFGGCHRVAHGAGFDRRTSFLCLPSLADPRIVLPLDSAPALAYHFRQPFYVESRRRRLLRRVLLSASKLGLLKSFSPGFALFATREART
jgi:hypothetical protein